MADDYLSDEERAEALRDWWRDNWAWIAGGIVLGVLLLVGWQFWTKHQAGQSAEAAQLYDTLVGQVQRQDNEAAIKTFGDITKTYGKTAYTQQARLLMAKSYVEQGKFDEAANELRAVGKESKDEELGQVANLRLARILLQQGKHDEALALLKPDSLGSFAGPAREIRGDVLVAKGDAEGARAEYAAALALNDATIDRPLIELKLQDVGGTAAPAATTAAAPAAPREAS